jgi:hypothetical protein
MSVQLNYSNPFFYNNLESNRVLQGDIKYNKSYPFIDLPNKILNSGDIESEIDNITLLDAKKRLIEFPLLIGFYFQTSVADQHIDNTTGKGVFYVYNPDGVEIISKSSDGGANRYTLYLKKNDERIPETVELAHEDDDYMGELDYVTLSIKEEDVEKIREMSINLDDNIDAYTGSNKPEYINGSFEREKDVGSGTNDNFHTIEYYFYVWEEINSPWFHNNGREASLTPYIEQVSDEEGRLNCDGTNVYVTPTSSYPSSKISNPDDDRDGYKLYTQNNTTGDFIADTSSNYIKIYRLVGSNSDAGQSGLPINNSINILAPKYSRFYFMWTYRINFAGKLILHDFPEDNVSGVGPREMLIEGTFPYFTPGININQLGLEFLAAEYPQGGIRPINSDYIPWTFSYINKENYGTELDDYVTIDVIRQFKPKRKPSLEYLNQNLRITIPAEDIEDLSKNFIDRFNPHRETPRFKTLDGDIYIHPFENNQILYCSYNIYIFKNKANQPVENDSGEQFSLYGERGDEVEGETILYTVKMNPRIGDFVIPFDRMTIQELEDEDVENNSILTLVQGNRYIFDLSNEDLVDFNVGINARDIEVDPSDGENEIVYWPDYKLGITSNGTQGLDGQIIFDVPNDAPRVLYIYNKKRPELSITLNIVTSNEESRDYTNTESSYPYIDKFTKVNFDWRYDISNNLLKIIDFPNSNFDFFDVPLQDRGDWAYKDASGGNASKLYDDDRENALTDFGNNTWFGLEEYSPDDVQILRPYLVDLKSYPYHVHILNTPSDSGWSSKWKTKQMFPQTTEIIIPVLENGEYYVRWNYTYHRYRYDKTRRFDPRYITWEDVSFNNGISPYSYFDFREYGVIYPPKELEIEYSRIEYPEEPNKYYKNLRLKIPGEQLQSLETNIIFNTDLSAEISLQFYIIKPKNRLDRDQNNPSLDLSANGFEDYDISFNLPAQYGQRFPMKSYIDISDNEVIETTLKPGRYYGIWSYTVAHSYININSREYPLVPVVDYYTKPVYFDISYNEFLYNNMEPIFKSPDNLTRLQLEISGNDIQNIINMWERYYKGLLSDQTYIEFWFLAYSPNFEHTQLLSGQNRWELPNDFTGDQDVRLYQTPVEYDDNRNLTPIKRVWLGNDNSDSIGAIYDWGYGGEPGIQFRKATYEDISNNELYNYKYGTLDISSGSVDIPSKAFELSEVLQIDAQDISNTNFMIEMTIPARSEEYDEYSAYWGFNNDPERACDTDASDPDSFGKFHIGINGNGADTITVEDTLPIFKQEQFIYKPPFEPDIRTTQEHYVRYRLDHTIENVLRYHFIKTPTRGFKDTIKQTGQQDVIIYLNGEMIYDFPEWGVTFDQITHIGQNYDASRNPITQNGIQVKFLFPIADAKQIALNDISNTSVLINTLVPQDFDEDDTEHAFYESQNYITDGLYVPYVSRWFYKIIDPVSEQYLESTILTTEYPNEIQRMSDWQIFPREDGGSEIIRSPTYPFENFYRYGIFYSIPRDFIAPKPFYPTQELDLSFNRITNDLIVTFDYERIVYPLLFNLDKYWRHTESLTTLTYYIYAWYPYSDKLPDNYNDVTDIADYHLWDDVYDISFAVTSPSPYHMANILPSIPYNVYTIGQEHLIFGKWVFAWNYKVENDAYRSIDRQRPDYIFFDVSAVEIHIPPILYGPKSPQMNYYNEDEYEGNEQIKLSILEKEILDLSYNVMHQLKGLLDVSGVRVNYYLWTPNREKTFDSEGWELPNHFYGDHDQRLYGAPVLYEEEEDYDTGNNKVFFTTPVDGEYGYMTSNALKKSIFIDISGGDFMDASCVYFTAEEVNSLATDGKMIYSNEHKKYNLYDIPYISRWSFEIIRNNDLPNYYSDISDNDYYRGPFFEITTDLSGNQMIENYDKINRYLYGKLYTTAPIEEPTVIIFDDEGLCSCPQNQSSITKSKEQQNYKMRIKTMLENFRFASRLRPRPASMDPRARDYSGNFIFKYKNDPCL